jgi:hypothetical protein
MSEHVLAVDPGGRSGWASGRMSEDRLEMTGGGVLRQDLMADWLAEQQMIVRAADVVHAPPQRCGAKTLTWGRPPRYDVVVYESWLPRRQNGSMDWIERNPLLSVQHVGQVRWITLKSGATLVTQHPSDKPTALASMPKGLLDLDRFSNEQHDKDARMHLWLYFFRNWFTASKSPEDTVIT